MKNPLNKRLLRDLKEHKGRYIAISIMLIITISVLSGFLSSMQSIEDGIAANKVSCKVEDGYLETFYEISKDMLNKIEDLDISIYENFYKDESILEDRKLRIYKDRENIDIPIITEGVVPEENNEIAIDRLFANQNDLKIGSEIDIAGEDYKITGTLAMPDYTSLFEKNSNVMMDALHFGVAIASDNSFENKLTSDNKFKYSFKFNDKDLSNKEKTDLSQDVQDLLVDNNIALNDFCLQENNQSISFIEDDMGSDGPMMTIFCYMLVVIMAFVFTVIIVSTIEEDAPIIGTLLANGYKKSEILSYYLKISMFVTIISAAIGNILGYTVMPNLFNRLYYESYSLPDFNIKLNSEAIIITTVIPILIMLFVNLVFIIKKLSISPLNFIRKDLKKHSNRKAVKLPNISFLKRFRLRVILQSKASFLILFVGIFLGSMILIFGTSMRPIINKYIGDIEESSISKYQYVLKAPYEIDDKDAEKFTMSNLKYYSEEVGKDLSIGFYGISEDSSYLKDLHIDKDESGIYLSDGLMKKIHANIGDTITFKNPYTEDKYDLEVVGSYNYAGGLVAFMNIEEINKLLDYDKNYFNGYFSDKDLDIEDKYLASVIVPEDMVKLGEQLTMSLGGVANICIVAAVIIYMALMYVLTKVIIEKNSLYISYMKVFGYNSKEIKKLYLNAATIFVVISLIVQIPIEKYFFKIVFDAALVKVSGYIEVFIPYYIYLMVIAVGIISYQVINYFHMRDVNKIEMSDALKNRE